MEERRAVVMGITGDWAFAAGTVLLALQRHNPHMGTDYLLYCDATTTEKDRTLLRSLGVKLLDIAPAVAQMSTQLTTEALQTFSAVSLVKFHCFSLLHEYTHVVWLDTDILIQDSIEDIFSYGPLALATEDPAFSEPAGVKPASINVHTDIPGFDGNCANKNSGVIVFNNTLPDPAALEQQCIDFINIFGKQLRYPDQAAFNYLVQNLTSQGYDTGSLPQHFNAHPRNPQATYAPIVHAFGAYKLWNDGLTATCFPEWQRDYARWCHMGGSPYTGNIDNAAYLEGSTFQLLHGLYSTISKAEDAIAHLQKQLVTESVARARLEALLQKKRTS